MIRDIGLGTLKGDGDDHKGTDAEKGTLKSGRKGIKRRITFEISPICI